MSVQQSASAWLAQVRVSLRRSGCLRHADHRLQLHISPHKSSLPGKGRRVEGCQPAMRASSTTQLRMSGRHGTSLCRTISIRVWSSKQT